MRDCRQRSIKQLPALLVAIRAAAQSVNGPTPIELGKSRNIGKLPKVTLMYPSLG
jgi:hypothetical protein